ncbi:hypothetical protein FRB94_003141 [Tulasnella sp. JGI-2019a]|nr:hypothetical protein FRB93_005219 [Tulasnella sp. JGI-2019a]KAG9003373.1 hypothetical protein FRB94_003141 [Tulasnella sp. JGI-2019a]
MTTTEHPATSLNDVLLLIFNYLSKKYLKHVSMVCRPWSTLATDTLWRQHQVPLSTVVARLPEFITTTKGKKKDKVLDRVHKVPWVASSNRFANKVKNLDFDETPGEDPSKSLAELLGAEAEGQSSLFPNLYQLSISADSMQCVADLDFDLTFKLLVTTSLSVVEVQYHDNSGGSNGSCRSYRNSSILLTSSVF